MTTNTVGLVRVVRRELDVAVASCVITVRVGGAVVEVPVGVDATTLTTVPAALGVARSTL